MNAVLVHSPPAVRESEDALSVFVESTRSWHREPVPLSRRTRTALWVVAAANLLVSSWLATVLTSLTPCSGFLCTIATLGDHHVVLLVLTGSCVAAMVGTAVMTGGLTRANGGHLAVLVPAAAVGVGAVLGVVLVLLLVTAVIAAVGHVLLLVIENL
jgi:hypothetical protein